MKHVNYNSYQNTNTVIFIETKFYERNQEHFLFLFQKVDLKLQHDIRMGAVMVHVILSSFCCIFRKMFFNSVNMYKIYFVCSDFCVAFHNDTTCSGPNCNFQTILLRNVQELLKKLDTFCFTYHHVGLSEYTFQVSIKRKIFSKEATSI